MLLLTLTPLQKIDKIKNRLTTMVDLVRGPSAETDKKDIEQDELEILQEAKIFLSSGKAIRKQKVKHIIFADSSEEGTYFSPSYSHNPSSTLPLIQRHNSPKNLPDVPYQMTSLRRLEHLG